MEQQQQQQQPILFLDVDGVLCLAGAGLYQLPEKRTLHPPAVSFLKKLIEETNCLVVVISSWRKKEKTLLLLKKRLEEEGGLPVGSIEKERVTPVIERKKRDEEVVLWLKENGREEKEGGWAVLDDSDGKFEGREGGVVRKRLVCVRSSVGISEGDFIRAKRLLLK